jgi:drug/metabolite transporter (DMT)-like permease
MEKDDMKIVLPILFALIAAIGNALFAFAQRKSAGFENGLLFVGISALVAFGFSFLFSPFMGELNIQSTLKLHWKYLLLSGGGLFLTYLGFNLLYSRYGVSQYVLYAVISIITTTIIVGFWWLKEPVNIYHKGAIALSVVAVILFSIGQQKA